VRVVRPARRRVADVVRRAQRPGGRPRPAAAARRTSGAVDGLLAGRPDRGVACHAGETVRRPGRQTAPDLSHLLAHDPRGGPAGRAQGGHDRRHRPRRGYSDAFGFSAAFKRVRGVTPSEFRRTSSEAPERSDLPELTTPNSRHSPRDRTGTER
jgi:hypothetical protein